MADRPDDKTSDGDAEGDRRVSPSSGVVQGSESDQGDEGIVQLPMFQYGISIVEGPLPPAAAMNDYDAINPRINIEILEDFRRRSMEAIAEPEHRRNVGLMFMAREDRELELRIAESEHSRKIGDRASRLTPYYIVGAFALIAFIVAYSQLGGAALAGFLSVAVICGTIVICIAMLRGPVEEREGRTIASVAKSISNLRAPKPPDGGSNL